MRQERNSNTEFLRIIAMLFIVMSHYSVHGGFDFNSITNTFNFFFLKGIRLGALGVDVFILLFGYYSVSSKNNNLKRAFHLWGQVLTYSLLLYFLYLFFISKKLNISECLTSVFPTLTSLYWFFTAYIIFFLLSPYINMMLNSLTQSNYLKYLFVMLFFWCLVPTITQSVPAGGDFSLFLLLYSLGGFLRLFPNSLLCNKKTGIILLSVSFIVLLLSPVCIFTLGKYYPILNGKENILYSQTSVLVIGSALGMSIIAVNLKRRINKSINYLASITFGVYLLHDNSLTRSVFWGRLFKCNSFQDSPLLIIHCLSTVAIIFAIGAILEFIRERTIDHIFDNIYDRFISRAKYSSTSK